MSAATGSSFLYSIGAALYKLPLAPSGKRVVGGIQSLDGSLTERVEQLKRGAGLRLLSLEWLSAGMAVVISSHWAVESLIPDLEQSPLSKRDEKWVSDFLDESAKLLDVCNGLRESVTRVEEWQMLLQLLLHNLAPAPLNEAQVRRARKAMAEWRGFIQLHGQEGKEEEEEEEEEGEEEEVVVERMLDRKKSSSWGSAAPGLQQLQRLQSKCGLLAAEGSKGGKKCAKLVPEMELLRSMTEQFLPPKGMDAGKGRNAFIAGMYAAKVTTVCILAVIYVTLSTKGGSQGLSLLLACSSQMCRQFGWATPLLELLEEVALEIGSSRRKKQNKRRLASCIWELGRIDRSVSRICELLEPTLLLGRKAFPLPADQEDEIRQELASLKQLVDEFDHGLAHLEEQVNELFRMLIASRTQLLDVLGASRALF